MTLIHLALQREIEVLNQGWMADGGWGGKKALSLKPITHILQ